MSKKGKADIVKTLGCDELIVLDNVLGASYEHHESAVAVAEVMAITVVIHYSSQFTMPAEVQIGYSNIEEVRSRNDDSRTGLPISDVDSLII